MQRVLRRRKSGSGFSEEWKREEKRMGRSNGAQEGERGGIGQR